jgi:hypothetical protein
MSIHLDRLLDVLDKAHSGPVYKDRDFNVKVIPQAIARTVRKYGLANTCDPDNPVNTDDDLADRFYQAGFEAAVEIGLLCKDTNRAIRFSEQELQRGIDEAPSEFWLGEGNQRVCYKHRDPEDPTPPVWTVPLSIAVTEDVIVPLVEGLARIPQVDALEGPSLETIWGRPLRSGSPYELLAGRHQADLMREGIQRAGRRWACPPTPWAVPRRTMGCSAPWRARRLPAWHDLVLILCRRFWTSYESLFKLAQVYNCGRRARLCFFMGDAGRLFRRA